MAMPESTPLENPSQPQFARFSEKRLKVLRAVGKRQHRYRLFRSVTQAITLGMLAAVPLSDTARFDLFTEQHRALGEPATPLYGIIAVAIAIFAFYFLTFQINLVAGRMFCGWGCPVGQLNRLWDTFKSSKGKQRLLWGTTLFLFAGLLMFGILLWWIAPGALFTLPYAPIAGAALGALIASALIFSRVIGWSFCRKACPIGLYYSVVQQKRPIGILFDESKCQQEGACVKACPVDLDPRALLELKNNIGGLAIDDLTSNSHCLRCGACVEACDLVTSKTGPVALMFGRPEKPIPKRGTADLVQLPAPKKTAPAPKLEPLPATEPAESLEVNKRLIVGGAIAVGVTAAVMIAATIGPQEQVKPEPPQPVAPIPKAPKGYQPAEGTFEAGQISLTGPNKHALVYLVEPKPGSALLKRKSIARPIGQFWSTVWGATPREKLKLQNNDGSLHTVAMSKDGRSVMNVPLPAGGDPKTLRAPSSPGRYSIKCANHSEERAELIVLDHPYFSNADENGSFALQEVPVGSTKLEIRTLGNTTTKTVEVTKDQTTKVSLELGNAN